VFLARKSPSAYPEYRQVAEEWGEVIEKASMGKAGSAEE
jgi:hypothetical protein